MTWPASNKLLPSYIEFSLPVSISDNGNVVSTNVHRYVALADCMLAGEEWQEYLHQAQE